MCELFGLSGLDKVDVSGYLKTFFSHSEEHPNGWGMSIFQHSAVNIEKEPIKANTSKYLKERLSSPLLAENMFAHIRLATIGKEEYLNCHPFLKRDSSGRTWTLMHNGTVFDCPDTDRFFYEQKGTTDSERILLYLIDQINSKTEELGRALNEHERFQVIDRSIGIVAYPNNKINLLIYDGDLMYVHTNLQDTLYRKQIADSMLFSTRPLDDSGWEKVEMLTPIAYRKGRKFLIGTNHGNEYHYDEDDMKYLYLETANL